MKNKISIIIPKLTYANLVGLFIITLPFLAFGLNLSRETIPASFIVMFLLAFIVFLKNDVIQIDDSTKMIFVFYVIVCCSIIFRLIVGHEQHGSHYFSDLMYQKDLKQLTMLSFIMLHYVILRKVLARTSKVQLNGLIDLFLLVSLIVSIYSFYQFLALQFNWPLTDLLRTSKSYTILKGKEMSNWLSLPRARAFMPESSFWGAYLLVPLGLIMPFALGGGKSNSRVNFKYFIVFLIALALSFARTGWFGFSIMYLYYNYQKLYRRKWLVKRKIVISTVFLISTALIIIMFSSTLQAFLLRLFSFEDFSSNERFRVQLESLSVFLAHPILGIGWGNTSYFLDSLVSYNFYIQLLLETGVLGFIAFVAFLRLIWKKLTDAENIIVTMRTSDEKMLKMVLGLKLSFIGILCVWINMPAYNFSYVWFILAIISVMPEYVRKYTDQPETSNQ